MDDRKLLELAAKAAGITVFSYVDDPLFGTGINTGELDVPLWNPLTGDGDALRLAVKCRIDIEWRGDGRVSCFQHLNEEGRCYPNSCESSREDIEPNTRRAIVRAAAEIGKVQKEEGE